MQQLFRLFIFLNQPNMFRRQIRLSSGAIFDCIHSFRYNEPPLLPTGATVEMEQFHLNRKYVLWLDIIMYKHVLNSYMLRPF